MPPRKIGYILIGTGVFIVLLMLIADVVGLGSGGIQAAQLLGMELGLLVVIVGYAFALSASEGATPWAGWKAGMDRFFSSPITAILAGVLSAYFLFSIIPMFFHEDLRFQYFNRYLPDRYPIGVDMQTLLGRIDTWFEIGTPYPGDIPQFYPPLTYAFFSPLTLVEYRTAFLITTLITLAGYVLITLTLPVKMTPGGRHSIVFLLFAAGLFSYGLEFELERGQYNVFTFLLIMLAVYIYHFHHRSRYIAYLLFSLAVQLKVFPAIFIFMFVRDWRDWRGNLRRFAGLGLFNLVLLFILGYRVFVEFLGVVTQQVLAPTWSWNGNHSIQAFVFNLTRDGYGLVGPDVLETVSRHASLITWTFLAIFLLCLLLVLLHSYRHNESEINPYLFLVCTLGALIIPTSNDYTLSFLIGPAALLFAVVAAGSFKSSYTASLLIFLASLSFASTLFPFKYKPYFLNNNFPALFLMLVAVTALYLLRNRKTDAEVPINSQ